MPLLLGTALVLTSALALAQDAPESLLPPGFERPARPARPSPAQPGNPAPEAGDSPATVSQPVVQALPSASGGGNRPAATAGAAASSGPVRNAPSLRELETMSPEALDQLLGLRPKFDIPPAARRSLKQVGVLAFDEGGMAAGSIASQDAALVRSMLSGNQGRLVSRWGHILLRRALVSRLSAPVQMNAADFVALRASLLVRMGEGEAARALVQDVDAANFTPDLTKAALDAYVATADITGICPAVAIQGGARKEADWQIVRAICASFSGSGSSGMALLDKASRDKVWPAIDVLLAQKYAGAAGKARRSVTIEWNGVSDMNPWRYALSIATGVQPPATLTRGLGWRYDAITTTAPGVALPVRAGAADRAAAAGVLSSAAMVDLYGQIYAQPDIAGAVQARAGKVREAYVGEGDTARLAAIHALWDDTSNPEQRFGRQVLTAYAAARLPVGVAKGDEAADLIAAMLAVGLDANALRWAANVDTGSQGWALLSLAAPARSTPVTKSALQSFQSDDDSEDSRKSAFLLAGLAGLGRVDAETTRDMAEQLGIDLASATRWTTAIDRAADANNAAMVAMLAGLGMQGDSWARMTPRYLYHIVAALNRVGLSAEARMIAAEAVARG
jgi:hypothetical protein